MRLYTKQLNNYSLSPVLTILLNYGKDIFHLSAKLISVAPSTTKRSIYFSISLTGYHSAFYGCVITDDFPACFTNKRFDAFSLCSTCEFLFHRPRLPKHIVQLRVKKRAWAAYKRTGDISTLKNASRIARAALRQHKRCTEIHLTYSNDR